MDLWTGERQGERVEGEKECRICLPAALISKGNEGSWTKNADCMQTWPASGA